MAEAYKCDGCGKLLEGEAIIEHKREIFVQLGNNGMMVKVSVRVQDSTFTGMELCAECVDATLTAASQVAE